MAEQTNSEPPGQHDLGHSLKLKNGQERAQKILYSDSLAVVDPPLVIRNGLKLKRQATGKRENFGSYTYALSPLTTAPTSVDWKIIAFKGADVVCEHIYCHEIHPDDDLDDLIAECRSNHAVAVILLNCDESHSLPKTVRSCFIKTDYPVLVLAAKDGKKLLQTLMEEDEDGDFLAKVLMKEPIEQSPKQVDPKSMHGNVHELCKDFKRQIKQHLYQPAHATCVSEDSELLKHVVAAFDHYEHQVQKLGVYATLVPSHCICEDLKKWRDKCDFGREFPLYLVLAYRLIRKRDVYMCNHYDGFVYHTIVKIEELPWRLVASTVETLVGRGNFQIKCQGLALEKSSMGVFEFMEQACEHILCTRISESQPRKTKGAMKGHKTPIAAKMFWTSLTVKFHSHGENQDLAYDLWQENIIKGCEDLVLKDDVISAMGKGLEFGRQLKLSPEVAFSSHHISLFLALPTFVRPFKHIRTFLKEVNLTNYINKEEDLVNLLESMLQSYRMWILQHPDDIIPHLSSKERLDEAIREGIAFLDELYAIKCQKQWISKDSELADKFHHWLILLIQLVDVRKPSAERCLRLFLEYRSRVCKEYRKKILARVKVVIKEKFQEITIHQFNCLYTVFFKHWDIEFLQEYLMNVKFQEDDRISPPWSQFFQEVMKHFTDQQSHQFLFKFLMRTGDHYAMRHSRFEFLVDLLVLKVPQLCAQEDSKAVISSEFYTFLQYYVCDEHLMDKMSEFLDRLSQEESCNPFMDLVMAVIMQDIFQKPITALRPPLKVVVTKLTSKRLEIKIQPSPLEVFCWRFLSNCCSKIMSKEDPNWIESVLLQPIMLELANVGQCYFTTKEWKEKECVNAVCDSKSLPEEITSSSEETVTYFEWVRSAQVFLNDWYTQITTRRMVNYDDVIHYEQHKPRLLLLAKKLFASFLVVDGAPIKQRFEVLFEELHLLMLRYIDNDPDGRWCTLFYLLRQYGVMIPQHIQDPIEKYIQFPNESVHLLDPFLKNPLPPSINRKFMLTEKGVTPTLEATTGLTFKRLEELIRCLKQFLRPINSYLDMLVFFTLHQSQMFRTYVKYELKRAGNRKDPCDCLQNALESTSLLIWNIVNGKAKYRDLVAGRTLNLEALDIDKELHILMWWVSSNNPDKRHLDFSPKVKALLLLSRIVINIDAILNVCKIYNLQVCLDDDQLKKLVELSNTLKDDRKRDEISLEDASQHKMEVEKLLCLQTDSDYKCLDLFPVVANSKDFYQFVQKRQFVGREGQKQFRALQELITAQLQHDSDEYEQTVLNHLSAAFQLIVPFTDSTQTFHELMSKVVKLDISKGSMQLETVKNNLHLIELWISRAEGDPLQNAINDLENILQTGVFKFLLNPEGIHTPPQVVLEYSPMAPDIQRSAGGAGHVQSKAGIQKERPSSVTTRKERWGSEEISNFVQILGLLDQERTHHTAKIMKFQSLNETAEKLLALFTNLKELGHPDFLHETLPTKDLVCSADVKDAEIKVDEAGNTLDAWKRQVEEWHNQYPHLLFFSVPKLLRLHENLFNVPQPDESFVANGITFLFNSSVTTQDQLRSSVKKVFSQHLSTSAMPMPMVGEFLKSLLQDVELKCFFMPRRYISNNTSIVPAAKPSWSTGHQSGVLVDLHCTPGFDKLQLLSTILGIYKGVPESFEFFRCSADTTELDLKKFVERVWKHRRMYMMFGVNNLPLHLQEVFVQHLEGLHQSATQSSMALSTLHCLEVSPSSLREIPWIHVKEYQATHPPISLEHARGICRDSVLFPANIEAVHLVYGQPGDGKTHFVKRMLRKRCQYPSTTITVNEGFTVKGAILELLSIPENAKRPTVFFNFTFTLLPPDYKGCEPKEKEQHEILINSISWFFFDLLVLGYVEDRDTGLSYRLPGDQSWTIYVEVPCSCWPDDISLSDHDSKAALERSLSHFQSEVPVLGLLGSPLLINHDEPLVADAKVQLVCKYLRAYHDHTIAGIDRLYVETTGLMKKREGKPIKFSTDSNMSQAKCNDYLLREMSDHIRKSKIIQELYIRYMHRRCEFLDNCPSFNYNKGLSVLGATDTAQLGSTLMKAMLTEVADFCSPEVQKNWSCKPHQQLIYDFRSDGGSGGALGYISANPEKVPQGDKLKLEKIGVKLPTHGERHSRKYLDELLSRALGLPLEDKEDGPNRLPLIDESAYVLTLDYTIKMLSIHERRECQMPVIIEGETGVGKTALVEMLSKLWNYSWNSIQRKNKDDLVAFLLKKLQDKDLAADNSDRYNACRVKLTKMIATEEVKEDILDEILQLPNAKSPRQQFYLTVRDHLLKHVRNECPVNLLRPRNHKDIRVLFDSVSAELSKEATLELISALLTAHMKQTFYRLQVHAALQPKDVWEFFDAVILQAEDLQVASSTVISTEQGCSSKPPVVTVFLDELNTSTCGGIFKEIIVDRTMNGKNIPFNVFIIAACNPHRGNSLAPTRPDETWVRGSYYVHRLHPTLRYLMWDYGALDETQEMSYIVAKIKLLYSELPNTQVDALADPIVQSQNHIRQYALDQLLECNLPPPVAKAASKSTVSQRDIQRFFTFYQWLLKLYDNLDRHEESDRKTKAMLVALSLVYYMRLNSKYRESYKQEMEELAKKRRAKITFAQVFQDELEWLISKIALPAGIARTQALKENVFATIVCIMTRTPLILIGPPGSSKTLSFHLVTQNLRGKESDIEIFQDTEIFSSVDPHFYQCSRHTTSHEINSVFSRAINRQSTYKNFALPIKCVILMDEAGLPEESLESLKALHYHLDQQQVSFVAITNHILDAAKSNRAVSLVVPEASKEDLIKLAKDCFCDTYTIEATLPQTASATHSIVSHPLDPKGQISPVLSLQTFDCARQSANERIEHCCVSYYELMKPNEACGDDKCAGSERMDFPFHQFFGLRDFIHFLGYLRRKMFLQSVSSVYIPKLTKALLLEGLERNFNGTENFRSICRNFLKEASKDLEEEEPVFRSITKVLRDSLSETPVNVSGHGEVRYKLIVDPSEDNSLIRYMFKFGVLEAGNAHVHMCSDLGDSHTDKVNTIASICHSAVEGHTVILSQVDKIQGSFYDLFNQRFRCIKNPVTNEHRYYANIAIGAHSKPSRVSPNFQCVVLLKESELSTTPAPFLNRFEKYRISYNDLIGESMNSLPHSMRIMMESAIEKVKQFVKVVEASHSLYGFREDTVSSLLLKLLPPPQHNIQQSQHSVPPCPLDSKVSILNAIVGNLRQIFGFYIPPMSDKELEYDAEHLFGLVQSEIQHSNLDELNITTSTVSKALNVLITARGTSQSETFVTDDIGLIFRLLVQWFTHYLCKALMQLMTPEALALLYKRIPNAYVWSYLVLQEHFSLKWLLSHYYELLETRRDRTDTRVIRKLLCFSHSFPKLPQLFSGATSVDMSMVSYLKKTVFSSTDQLVIVKLSVSHSQRNVRELLRKFSFSKRGTVLLLAVNTLEVSQDAINHLRVMIEEVEALPSSENKLFALLLQISDVVLGRVSYPSLFIEGWNHHYISTIPTAHPEYVADTKQWFMHSIFPECGNQLSTEDRLLEVLKDVFPILTSRVGFTASADETNHATVLKRLLFEGGRKGEKGEEVKEDDCCVGKALCSRFLTYWSPKTTAEYLHQAAYSIQKSDSTLRLSDTLQKMFKSKFFDYLVYMVSKIHADCNILGLVQHDPSDDVMKLFVDVIKTYPAPKLSQLKLNSMLGIIPSAVTCDHSFPYFSLLSELVDVEIASCKQFGPHFDLPPDDCERHDPPEHVDITEPQLVDEAKRRLLRVVQDEAPPCLAVALKQMAESKELWQKYFSDFASEKLHVRGDASGAIMSMLRSWHQQKVDQSPIVDAMKHFLANIVSLHVSVQHLSKVTSILRPIADLETMAQQIPSDISKANSRSPHLEIKGSIFERPEAICLFVVDSLFQLLAHMLIGQTLTVQAAGRVVAPWNAVYQKIISIPLFKKWIYEHLSSQTEGKLNLMHTTYLIHQLDPTDEECRDLSNVAFTSLYNRHFEPEKDEIKARCPHLKQLMDVVLGVLVHKRNKKYIVHVAEGLLEHCFSEYRKQYHPEDIHWFLELANQQLWDEIYPTSSPIRRQICDLLKCESFTEHFPSGCISLNVLKFYLSRILSMSKAVSFRPSVVVPWNNETRLEIGEFLVAANQSSDPPGSYIPAFYGNNYTEYTQNILMRQPLAHLYFYTTLEHLIPFFFKQKISSMLEFVAAIEKEYQSSKDSCEGVVLLIEKQALVQVLIRECARALATSKGREAVVVIKDDLNLLLDNNKMGGTRPDGKASGHGVTLAMHTIRQMKSIENFFNLPDGSIIMEINCLKPFLSSNVQRVKIPSCHLFPFMLPGEAHSQTSLSNLYQKLCTVMNDVHRSGGTPAKVQALLKFTERKLHHHLPFTSSHGTATEKTACVRLMLWLCTYHEFYNKNEKSETLADVINESKMVELLGGQQYAHLIRCFLNPDLMVSRPELVAKNLPHIPVANHELDLVYELFHPSFADSLRPSDLELRHAIANIIAAVLGTPEKSTHLWLHMFSPNDLDSTYMTGFMFDAPVSRQNGMFYNFGIQLKSGIYAKHSYLKHATRGTLNLHSLYFLLWANFSAFCVSLITSQNADIQLRSLLSDDLPVRSYCISQLRSLWTYMRNSLHVLDEELAFLIQRCSDAIVRESVAREGSSNGKFENKEDLDAYECWWHKQIFMPSKQEMDEKFLSHSGLYNHKGFTEIRQMETHYPKFPTENEFLQYILNYASSEQDPSIRLLSQFALEYPRLELARSLLPQLLELYWWLHTNLAHMISSDTAQKTTVKQLMAHLENYYRNDPDKMQRLKELFHSVKDHFNQYAHLTGVAPDDTGALPNPRVFTIEDNTLVIQLLSVPLRSDQTTNDQLYRVIVDLVRTHNHMVEMLAQAADSCPHEQLHRHIPSDSTKVYLQEVSQSNSAVENFSEIYHQRKFLQLVRRRCVLPTIGTESFIPDALPQFNLQLLLQDIASVFLSGKPQIHNPSAQHIPYCFRVPPNRTRAHLSENGAQELANINHKLPQEYKEPLGSELLKNLEYRFHKATLETYDEVVTGLTTVAQYLIESLRRNGDIDEAKTLQCFICEVYQCEESNVAFERAGITSLSAHQLSCFLDMKLQNVYHTLHIFVQWIEDGYYDFQSLPYATKTHLCIEDEQVLQQLQQHYNGSPMELLEDLKYVTVLLNQLETNIVEIVSSNPQEPITNLLSDLHAQKEARNDGNELMLIMPQSIQVNQYVALRVALRRLTLEVERCLPAKQRQGEGQFEMFEELVTDFWQNRMTHVQRVPGGSTSSEDYYAGSHQIQRETSSMLDPIDDDYLDDYSDPDDDSSYAATVSYQPPDEEFSTDEWVEDEPQGILATILESVHLGHYIDWFADEKVTEGNLHVLADDDLLKDIGINSALDRLKIILQIQKHKSGMKTTQEYSVEKVTDFLQRTQDMKQYVLYFEEKQIDGDLLLAANDEILQEIGIHSAFDRLKVRIYFQREVRGHSALAQKYPVDGVVALLKANNMDVKYQLALETHKIDGELLTEASDQVLQEIGIKSRIHQRNIKKLIQQ